MIESHQIIQQVAEAGGMSVAQLAAAAGYKKQTLTQYKSKGSNIAIQKIEELCEAVGLQFRYSIEKPGNDDAAAIDFLRELLTDEERFNRLLALAGGAAKVVNLESPTEPPEV